MDGATTPSIRLISMTALGPFSWRWPEDTESFERGWLAVASLDDQEFQIRHGIGRRHVYGRPRVHSVTWVEGDPTVEGVEADDFDRSESLMSLIKVTKRHLRPGDPVPSGYRSFVVAVMSQEASGPYSPRGETTSMPVSTGTGPAPVSAPSGALGGFRAEVVAGLLAYAKKLPPRPQGASVDFTPNKEANDFVSHDPFAFLTGVLFDQGVPAERAWIAPYLLRQRLGHLDPARIAADPETVRAAIEAAPKLHRYVAKMPVWVVLAARRVTDRYGGDASGLWSDHPGADELQRRFDAFVGIGQKKAAMAVEILERELGVPIADMDRSDIAYDVHIRRVFLRTRLADRDDRDHMIAVARKLHPSRPGALDPPSWLIGRGWCHPGIPDCASCPLTQVCPKDIERAAHVTSG